MKRITALTLLAVLAACGEIPTEPTALDVESAAAQAAVVDLNVTSAPAIGEVIDVDARLVGSPGGPAFSTGTLQAGVEYRITVDGNWSAWLPSWWTCTSPYPTKYLSPSVPAGTNAGFDAEWRYADAGNCNRADTPWPGIQFSLDGGVSFFDPTPVDGTFNADHIYEYIVTGTGQKAGFYIPDTNADNHGVLKVTIEETDPDTDGDGVPDSQDVEPNLNNNYYYVDWTSANPLGGTAAGTITLPGGETVGVTLRVVTASGSPGVFLSANTSGGTNYWAANNYGPYKSGYVLNPPPDSDILQLTGGNTSSYIIEFTQPVQDPAMAIHSLGGANSAIYDFDKTFEIVSQGPGHHGGGYNSLRVEPGQVLWGWEGNGTIRFIGSFHEFTWTAPQYEKWHGFTFAIRGLADANADYDGDGIPDESDSCPLVANTGSDFDHDGIDDACDSFDDSGLDTDGDGLTNGEEYEIGTNPTNPDTDGDGYNDGIDGAPLDPTSHVADADGDGYLDTDDNCPAVANADQTDTDGDGAGDACDDDDDGDGVADGDDAFPLNPNEWADSDGDGVGDNADVFPNDPNESADSDGDGVGDNADQYPGSNLDDYVSVGGCITSVPNQVLPNGGSLNDLMAEAMASAENHGGVVSAVTQLADQWKKDGLISGREKGAITSCVARSDAGKKKGGR